MVKYLLLVAQQICYVRFLNFNKTIAIFKNSKLDVASGASPDWAYGVKKIIHSYVIELRPRNGAGVASFDLNIAQIPLVGFEIYNGVKALLNFI
jgi:hypothetical protein